MFLSPMGRTVGMHVNIIPPLLRCAGQFLRQNRENKAGMKTLLEFADEKMLTRLLVKERAKCRKKNRDSKDHGLDKECALDDLKLAQQLSRMMPPRHTWVKPRRRKKLANGVSDRSRNAARALWLTIERDRKRRRKEGVEPDYLRELDGYVDRIRRRLTDGNLSLTAPRLIPILKDVTETKTEVNVMCRPLSTYRELEDKIVLAVTSRYLTRYLDGMLHENILSYRAPRDFDGERMRVTDFNDGIRLIREYVKRHKGERIYAADCDIKKFYDIIPHRVVTECFERMLAGTDLSQEGREQVMRVVRAYLKSYNFYENALRVADEHREVFCKLNRRFARKQKTTTRWRRETKTVNYTLGWVDELRGLTEEEKRQIGVPQGGALSLLVANVVLNDVDRVIVEKQDEARLFVRFCDDMILLHTDEQECRRLMEAYTDSLTRHGLYYHEMQNVGSAKVAEEGRRGERTSRKFWKQKSHKTFLWGDGSGDSNRYIGFLGYEMRRDGRLRLRRSNIKRMEEKLRRVRYALKRYSKRGGVTAEELREYCGRLVGNILDGVKFYRGLNLDAFKAGLQYRHLECKAKESCDGMMDEVRG